MKPKLKLNLGLIPVNQIKKNFITLLLSIITILVYSNDNQDSLIIELGHANHDSVKVDILNKIARGYHGTNFEKSLIYNHEAIKLAKKIKYTRGLANSYNILGHYFFYRGDKLNALDHFLEAKELFESLNDSIKLGYLYNFIGKCQTKIRKDSSVLINYHKAYKIFHSLNDSSGQIFTLTNLGEFYQKSNNDSLALVHFNATLKLINEYKKTDVGPAFILIHSADIKFKKSYFVNARKEYFKALNILKTIKNKNSYHNKRASIYNKIGETYLAQNQCDSAIIYAQKSIQISNVISSLSYKQNSYKLLSKCYYQNNKLEEAYYFLDQYSQIKDSILDQKIAEITQEIELKHQYENEHKLQKYELEQKNKALRIKNLQISLLFLAVIIIGLIGLYILLKGKNRLKLSYKKQKSMEDELVNLAIYILQKNDLVTEFRNELLKLRKKLSTEENIKKIDDLINSLIFKIAVSKDIDLFRNNLRTISDKFFDRLNSKYPNLTEKEKQLTVLLRLNFSSKQISTFLNLTRPSVDVYRVRLRKKLGLQPEKNLTEYLNQL